MDVGNRTLLGASVIPYAIDEQHNNLYVLLGSERVFPKWRESGKFSDFGGACKDRETPEMCAAREFFEETSSILSDVPGLDSVDSIREAFEKQKYTFRITTICDKNRFYVTFVKQIPFDASIHRRFAHNMQILCHARQEARNGGVYRPATTEERTFLQSHPAVKTNDEAQVVHVKRDFVEKQSLQWVSLPHVREAIMRGDSGVPPCKMPPNAIVLRDTFRWRMKKLLPKFEEACQSALGRGRLLSRAPVKQLKSSVRHVRNQAFHHRRPPPGFERVHPKPSQTAGELDVGEKTGKRVISSSAELARRPLDPQSRNFEFRSESQRWVLLNIAHQQQKCRSNTASFRILGLFKSKGEATAHSKRMNSDLDIYVLPCHSWFPITIAPVASEEEAVEVQKRTVERVEGYVKQCSEESKRILDDANEEQATERYEKAMEKNRLKEELQRRLDEGEDDSNADDTVEIVPRQHEVRNQSYAVFSIVSEVSMDDEPCVNILRAFDTKDDARDYLRNTVHSEEVVTDCFVGSMYEWITPAVVHTKKFYSNVEAHYSHSQLEEIHKGKKADQKKIENLLASRGHTVEDVDRFMEERFQNQQQQEAKDDGPTLEIVTEGDE